MGYFRRKLLSWLGEEIALKSEQGKQIVVELERCRWMEAARKVMASYVTAALQLSEVRFYDRDGQRDYGNGAWLWNVSPNPNQSRSEFLDALCHRLLAGAGEALVVPRGVGGRTTIHLADGFSRDLRPLSEDRFSNITLAKTNGSLPGELTSSQVFYLTLGGGADGWSALMAQLDAQYGQLADSAIAAMRDNTAPKWLWRGKMPAFGTEEQEGDYKAKLKESLKSFVTAKSPTVLPLFEGQDLECATSSQKDSPIMPDMVAAIRKDMFETAAVCMRIPTSLLYGNTNNFAELVSALLTFAVDPVARLLEDELTRKMYTPAEWRYGAHVSVDTTHVRHVDLFSVADQVAKLVGSSVDSPNEIRGFTGQDRIAAPWADEYQRTKNNEDAGGGETK